MMQSVDGEHFTERTRLRRFPENGSHSREDLTAVLDAAFYGHLAVQVDSGSPFVVPTIFGYVDNLLYVHGSVASQSLRQGAKGVEVTFVVTVVDAFVLARSVFEHSLHYRSAVIYSLAEEVSDQAEKEVALRAISDHAVPGQWGYARTPNEMELRKTRVLRLTLDEFSVKVSDGPPGDSDSDDADLDVWAGIIPIRSVADAPVPDPALRSGIELPLRLEQMAPPGSSKIR